MKQFTELAIKDIDQFVFGQTPHPLTVGHGLVLGGGTTYPELNFTLPAMELTFETMPEVKKIYQEMIDDACQRAVELHVPGLVVEFETLPPMTMNPDWATEITVILRSTLDRFYIDHGLKNALRVTPNDTREHERPPLMRSGPLWNNMMRTFEQCAAAGADLLAIESTGGKEVSDTAILNGDLQSAVFALGILGARDMENLWTHIGGIAHKYGRIASGDTACGFGNTAMVLADRHYIPKVWAAVVRLLTVPRSLVAYEAGALGPSKDCAYEGPYMKAITGYPISMEGADSACAHLSPVGNIARAVCDLWSNESVQHIKLLGGMAPTVSLEQLAYSCRLMNTASSHGNDSSRHLRDWFVESDSSLDPQAYVLRPDVVLDLSAKIIEEKTAYLRTRRAAFEVLETLRKAHAKGEFQLPAPEVRWLDRLSAEVEDLPEDEEEMIATAMQNIDTTSFRPEEYGIATTK